MPSRIGSRPEETSRMVVSLEALTAETMITTTDTASMAAVRTMTKFVALVELSKPTRL